MATSSSKRKVPRCCICGNADKLLITECATFLNRTTADITCMESICKAGHDKSHFCLAHRSKENVCIKSCCNPQEENDNTQKKAKIVSKRNKTPKPAGENDDDDKTTDGYVREIVDDEIREDGALLFKVFWEGYPDDDFTWEPEDHLPIESVKEYRLKKKTAATETTKNKKGPGGGKGLSGAKDQTTVRGGGGNAVDGTSEKKHTENIANLMKKQMEAQIDVSKKVEDMSADRVLMGMAAVLHKNPELNAMQIVDRMIESENKAIPVHLFPGLNKAMQCMHEAMPTRFQAPNVEGQGGEKSSGMQSTIPKIPAMPTSSSSQASLPQVSAAIMKAPEEMNGARTTELPIPKQQNSAENGKEPADPEVPSKPADISSNNNAKTTGLASGDNSISLLATTDDPSKIGDGIAFRSPIIGCALDDKKLMTLIKNVSIDVSNTSASNVYHTSEHPEQVVDFYKHSISGNCPFIEAAPASVKFGKNYHLFGWEKDSGVPKCIEAGTNLWAKHASVFLPSGYKGDKDGWVWSQFGLCLYKKQLVFMVFAFCDYTYRGHTNNMQLVLMVPDVKLINDEASRIRLSAERGDRIAFNPNVIFHVPAHSVSVLHNDRMQPVLVCSEIFQAAEPFLESYWKHLLEPHLGKGLSAKPEFTMGPRDRKASTFFDPSAANLNPKRQRTSPPSSDDGANSTDQGTVKKKDAKQAKSRKIAGKTQGKCKKDRPLIYRENVNEYSIKELKTILKLDGENSTGLIEDLRVRLQAHRAKQAANNNGSGAQHVNSSASSSNFIMSDLSSAVNLFKNMSQAVVEMRNSIKSLMGDEEAKPSAQTVKVEPLQPLGIMYPSPSYAMQPPYLQQGQYVQYPLQQQMYTPPFYPPQQQSFCPSRTTRSSAANEVKLPGQRGPQSYDSSI